MVGWLDGWMVGWLDLGCLGASFDGGFLVCVVFHFLPAAVTFCATGPETGLVCGAIKS